MRSLELFTGAGGLALGTHAAGFKHVALLDWNRDACTTLRENIRHETVPGVSEWKVVEGDVRRCDYGTFGPLQLVAGGPPCQPFSLGGKHRGVNDDRDMIPEFIRAIHETQPAAFLFENVKGLTRKAFRNYLSYIELGLQHPEVPLRSGDSWEDHLARLEDVHTRGTRDGLHYRIVRRLLNAADYGVPQTRERVFIVGFRRDLDTEWHFPEPTHSRDRLQYDQWVSGEYWEARGLDQPEPPSRLKGAINRTLTLYPSPQKPWTTLRDAISDLPKPRPCGREPDALFHRLQPGARAYPGHTGSPLDLPAKTLKAGVHGVPGGENMIAFSDGSVRYLTVREAARVQTFPDDWRFTGSWTETMRQLGNAVPMQLAVTLAESIAAKTPQHV
ncbi:MAG: DNA cytosine methyltransferase [Acidobacteriota bacterium]|nr:DNA cytosine methyltransferase [Acidobacteriota bacterium]MDE3265840.1 DNA cytosine methyltransferase [Acidobacteriota bacterium]